MLLMCCICGFFVLFFVFLEVLENVISRVEEFLVFDKNSFRSLAKNYQKEQI